MNPVISLYQGQLYNHKSLVLEDVNFQLQPGEFVYLIGKTGSGKSTLLRHFYGQLPLQSGTGAVAGVALETLKNRQVPFLRRKLGIIFQDFQLLTDRNVQQNLLFVLRATGWTNRKLMDNRVREVMDMVQLPGKGYKMPHELSGGEQQKVVIARALLNNPAVILADEPTGNLDPDFASEIIRLLHRICHEQNTAVLMATHDYRLIELFPSRVIKIEGTQLRTLN